MNLKKILSFVMGLTCLVVLAKDSELIRLHCEGNVQFNDRTSKKSNPSLLEVDITFDSKTNRIIGFTPLLAEGCFQSDGPTSSKSSCKCTIDDEILQCKSIGYRSDTGWKNEASFFVNRWTGKMSTIVNITDNADLVYGWTGFDLRCNKVDSAKF